MPTLDTCGPLDLDDALELVEEVKRAARTGLPLDKLGDKSDSAAVDPEHGYLWARRRRIPAALVRQILTDQSLIIDPRGLWLKGVCIIGELNLDYLSFARPLRLTSCYFEKTFSANGIRALDVDLNNSCLPGLQISGARLDGDLNLDGLKSSGPINALCAHVSGQLKLQKANLSVSGTAGISLILDSARIEGGAYFEELESVGTVSIAYAHIAEQLDLESSILTRNEGEKNKYSLVLDGAYIKGHVLLARLRATGAVRAVGATITGQLDLNYVKIKDRQRSADPAGGGFFAQSLKTDSIILQEDVYVQGQFNLTRAEIGNLAVRSCPNTGTLLVAGWRIEDIPKLDLKVKRVVAEWLKQNTRTPCSDQNREFVAQPWKEVADVFERNGQSTNARSLRIEAERLTTRAAPWREKWWRMAYGGFVAYGYRSGQAALWLIMSIAVASLLTYWQVDSFVRTNPSTLVSTIAPGSSVPLSSEKLVPVNAPPSEPPPITGRTPCKALDQKYPCLDAFQYGLATVLPPAVSTEQTSSWRTTNLWLFSIFQILRIFAWLFIALLLGGISGLLRKT